MSARNRNSIINNILIVDDEEESLKLTSHLLKDKFKNTNIVRTRYPSKAIHLATNNFFDIILIDITINYQGSPFGGLEIYNSLVGRYGGSSIIAYSKFITDDLLKQYHYEFNFIEKGSNSESFIDNLDKMIVSLRRSQKCFVAMPFDSRYRSEYRIVKLCIESNYYTCLRIDREIFNESIVNKIFEEIKDAKIVVFLTIDKNPNVFYEAGFAMALKKEIITLTDSYSNLPFDVRDKNAIAYGRDLKKLQLSLTKKLANLSKAKIVSHE